MPTDIHKHTATMIWQQWSTLDIVAELRNKFDIGVSGEQELEAQVIRLRKEIKEARELAPAAAKKFLEDGYNFAEVKDILMRPYLLSGFEVDGIIARAQAVIAAEK